MFDKYVLLVLPLGVSALSAQQGVRMDLGRPQTGATVSFARSTAGEWAIEIAGAAAPRIQQPKPARLEVFRSDDDICQLAAGYKTVQKTAAGVDARAEITYAENVVFRVNDRWRLSGAVLSLRRTVEVAGSAPGGFYSSILLTVDPAVSWPDVNYMAPAALYGDPSYDGDRSPGGRLNYAARRIDSPPGRCRCAGSSRNSNRLRSSFPGCATPGRCGTRRSAQKGH